MTRCNLDRILHLYVLLLVEILLMVSLVPEVEAFQVIDKAMCKGVNLDTFACEQRTNEFFATDKWAYFWFRAIFDASDVGAQAEFKFYEPSGNVFTNFGGKTGALPPYASYFGVAKAGEVVWWIGIGVTHNNLTAYVPGNSLALVSFKGTIVGQPPASEKPGEWRAEFTLANKVVVTERFSIGETTTASVLTNNLTLVAIAGAVLVVVALVAVYARTSKRDDNKCPTKRRMKKCDEGTRW